MGNREKAMTKKKWIKIDAGDHVLSGTYRLEVPGGWLYRMGMDPPYHLTFVPTPTIEFKPTADVLLPVMAVVPEFRRGGTFRTPHNDIKEPVEFSDE